SGFRRIWQREIESGAPIHFALGPRAAAVATDDTPHISQADPGSLEILHPVKALENAEKFRCVLDIEAHAVVTDVEDGFAVAALGADFNQGFFTRAGVFDRIRKQILKNEPQHKEVCANRR